MFKGTSCTNIDRLQCECRFLVEGRGSRVEGKMSRLEGKMSRVEGKMSRVESKMSRVQKCVWKLVFPPFLS